MSATGVLLLPGWGTGPELLAGLVPPRAACVVSPDWRAAKRPEDLVALAIEAAGGIAGDRLLVVGWSLGAMVALEALPALPGRLAAMHLVAPCLRFTDAWSPRVLERMRRRCARDPEPVLDAFARTALAPGEHPLRSGSSPPWPAPALDAGLAYLACRALPAPESRPGCTVRMVHGGSDPVVPADLSKLVAEVLGAERKVLPLAGHAPQLTRAAECTAFLAEEGGRGGR